MITKRANNTEKNSENQTKKGEQHTEEAKERERERCLYKEGKAQACTSSSLCCGNSLTNVEDIIQQMYICVLRYMQRSLHDFIFKKKNYK